MDAGQTAIYLCIKADFADGPLLGLKGRVHCKKEITWRNSTPWLI